MTLKKKGEGDHEAGRNYRRRVKSGVESNDIESAAEDAAESVADPEERQELEKAEKAAKEGPDLA